MSREAARTATKSKMELFATSLDLLHKGPTPDSTGFLDTLICFLKIY